MNQPAIHQPAPVLPVAPAGGPGNWWCTHATALASLPRLFRPGGVAARTGDDVVVAVDGTGATWPVAVAAALNGGACGILLDSPTAVRAEEARELAGQADRAGCPVVVAMPFSFDSAVRVGLAHLRGRAQPPALVESMAEVPNTGAPTAAARVLRAALIAQLAAVRLAAGPVSCLELSQDTRQGYLAAGDVGATAVVLGGSLADVPGRVIRLTLVGAGSRHSVRVQEDPVAAPAELDNFTAAGRKQLSLSYSGGLRAAWQQVHAAVTARERPCYGLRELAADLALVPPPR